MATRIYVNYMCVLQYTSMLVLTWVRVGCVYTAGQSTTQSSVESALRSVRDCNKRRVSAMCFRHIGSGIAG